MSLSPDPYLLSSGIIRASLHGITRAAISKAQGGKWSAGFWSGFASSALAPLASNANTFEGKVAMSAIVGGTASELGGGKFANGAVTGAFVMMYNEMAHANKSENALSLLDKWAKRKGGEYYFDSDHPMTIDLQYSPKLQKAINQWILENHDIGDASRLSVSFFPIGEGMLNLTRQFVGSFSSSIYQLDVNRVGVYIYNNTSIKSAMYHIGLPDNYGQDYMLKQHYYFEETY